MTKKTTIIIELILVIICSLSCSDQKEEYKSASGEEIKFKYSSFTFVRINYSGSPGRSMTDYPDSDLNFSAKFHEETGLKTDPKSIVLELTDPDLKKYPFIYMVEGGGINLNPQEVTSLRSYLLGGGFLMVDDFWGQDEWKSLYSQMKKVFPEREPVRLNIEHEIFNCFYQINEKPQVPAINYAVNLPDDTLTGITTERSDAPSAEYFGIFDDKDRLIVILCHNTDLGDGWERAGVSKSYYEEFSLKKAYPMGINIVVYALTH